jgi:acyl-CoA thioesterase FadM
MKVGLAEKAYHCALRLADVRLEVRVELVRYREARVEGEYECSDAAMLAMVVIALCVVESFRDVPQVVEIAITALVVWAVGLAIRNFPLPGSDDRPVPE